MIMIKKINVEEIIDRISGKDIYQFIIGIILLILGICCEFNV